MARRGSGEGGIFQRESDGRWVATVRDHLDAYVAPEPEAHVFTRPSGRPLRRSDLSNAWHAACAVVGSRACTRTT